jgi:hypothetical protein
VLANYLQAVEAGRRPDRETFLAAYPEFADELRSFFADGAHFWRHADPVAPVHSAEAPTLAAGEPATGTAALGTVRYFGDYDLLEEIARCGMGDVFKAKQLTAIVLAPEPRLCNSGATTALADDLT